MRAGRGALLVVSVLVTLLAMAGAVSAATPSPGAEADFVSRIAGERSSRGLGPLRVADDLVVVARRHAERMAARGEPYHNPSLTEEVHGWQVVGENVGKGPDVADLHGSFMASRTHRDQIVFPGYTELGVGVVESGGSLYVVQVFRQPMAAADEPPAPEPEAPSPAQPAPPATEQARPTSPPAPPAPAPAPSPAPEPAAEPAVVAPPAAPAPTPVAPSAGAVTVQSAGAAVPGPPLGTLRPNAGNTSTSTLALAASGSLPTPREVSPAVGVATGLLALVVGLQGIAVRRLGLA